MWAGLPGTLPRLRLAAKYRGTRPRPRQDRPPLGEARRHARHGALRGRWDGSSRRSSVTIDRAPLLKAIGIDLPDELLTIALTHRSYAYENGGLPTNERLEFLGDAVLGLVITAEIFEKYPDRAEGELAKLKSAVVNTQALAGIARTMK